MKWTRCVATGGEVRALNDASVPRRALGAARDRDRDGRAASIPPRCRPCRCRLVFSSRPVASRSRRLIPPTPHPHPPPPSPQPPPSPRSGHSATLVGTSHLVVFGGLNVKTAIGDTVALHLERNQWRRPPSSAVGGPGPRAFHCAVAIGSRLYVMCGRTGRQQHGDVWCLDCVSWCWRRLRPTGAAPSPRDFGVAAATPSGGILLFGGYDGHKWLNDCHVLENIGEGGGESATWRVVSVANNIAPTPRSGHAIAAVERRLLVFGGQASGGTLRGDLWALRGVLDDENAEESSAGVIEGAGERRERPGPSKAPPRWTRLQMRGVAPSPRAGHAFTSHGSRVVLHGGHGDDGWISKRSVYYDDVTVIDRETGRWRKLSASLES